MTLGDMIKEYLQENTMVDFCEESGISRAYAYMLIKNKNNDGGKITPSIETVKKVAKGIHIPFDEVIARLDDDIMIRVEQKEITKQERELIDAFNSAPEFIQLAIRVLLGLERK